MLGAKIMVTGHPAGGHVSPGARGKVVNTVQASGRSLFRVALAEPSPVNMQSAASTFSSMGYLVEVYSPMMLAVDAADEQGATFLSSYLQRGEDAGE